MIQDEDVTAVQYPIHDAGQIDAEIRRDRQAKKVPRSRIGFWQTSLTGILIREGGLRDIYYPKVPLIWADLWRQLRLTLAQERQ